MRRAFMAEATARGYAVLDLHAVFAADYARHGRPFDHEFDYHWNGYGHGVVAGAVRATDWYARVTGRR
jgi:hypothetical protein